MNALEITTTNTNSIFDTKEEYVAFRAKWKQLHADGFHKPRKVEYECGPLVRSSTGHYEWSGTAFNMVSRLTVWHHLVFNLAIGRTVPGKAFPKVSEATASYSKPYLWHALGYTHGAKHDFEPFGDTLTDVQKTKLTRQVEDFRNTL